MHRYEFTGRPDARVSRSVPKDLDQRLLSTAFLLVHNCDVDENLVGNEEPIKSRLPVQSSSGRAVRVRWCGLGWL